jgi:iron complex transport system permease protein
VIEKHTRWIATVLILFLILIGVSLLSLSTGAAGIPPANILPLLLKGQGSAAYSILVDIRLPRLILGFAVGGALSLTGVILQGMFRNSLVEPYTLGISGGAASGVCVTTILGLGHILGIYALPLSGFLGGFIVVLFLYPVSIRSGILKTPSLLLMGVMVNFISSSFVILIMSISRAEDLHNILFWIIGSLGETDWILVKLGLCTALAGLAASYFFCFNLNAMALGEEEALHLGIDVERTKRVIFIIAALLTGVCVSLSGAIGFVGLVVPHFVRMCVGVDHRIVMISSFLSGAIFLILCDTIAKTVALPMELPVGVITGIVGGILFIYALTKRELSLGGR